MALPTPNGTLYEVESVVVPDNTGTWGDLTSWATFNQWAMSPVNPLIYNVAPFDLGTTQTFNLKIKSLANGRVEYIIHTSDVGTFTGEETATTIVSGQENIPGFNGRYVLITVNVYETAGVNVLYGVEYAVSQAPNSLSLNDVNSANLTGSSSNRTLTVNRSLGAVTNIQITPKAVDAYPVDLYVSNVPTSTTVIPRVISKTAPVQFALVGIDGQPRDALVDIVLEYLPEGYMNGNDLLVR
jgi:hypothetical protein